MKRKRKKLTPQEKRGTDTFGIVPIKRTVEAVPHRPKEWTEETIEIERIALERWIKNPNNYYFTAFLNERKLGPEQIERFARESQFFCETYARAKRIQEERLIELAVSKKGDGNFIKFILQNKAGWKEKQEISGDSMNPLAVIMDRIADSAKDALDYDG